MPELPEVETVRRGLEPVLAGRRILRLEARRPDLRFPFPERFAARVEGRRVTALTRRAKYLLAAVEGGETLIMHLGMTGRFTIEDEQGPAALGQYVYGAGSDPRHDHVVLHLSGGGRITYNDARRFGFMVLVPPGQLESHPLMKGLGPEPLSSDFTADALAQRAAGKKVNLKGLLMDQRVVAGLGNIYVCEALHRARLSPERSAATLASKSGAPLERTHELVAAIRSVLEEAIRAGGSTLRDYRHADGTSGQFQDNFAVYDRAGEGCARAGCSGTLRRAVHANRSTFYCPKCQR